MTEPASDAVRSALRELGVPDQAISSRTILIRAGHFVGYRYGLDDGHVVWLVDQGLIERYDRDGAKVHVVRPEAIQDQEAVA